MHDRRRRSITAGSHIRMGSALRGPSGPRGNDSSPLAAAVGAAGTDPVRGSHSTRHGVYGGRIEAECGGGAPWQGTADEAVVSPHQLGKVDRLERSQFPHGPSRDAAAPPTWSSLDSISRMAALISAPCLFSPRCHRTSGNRTVR